MLEISLSQLALLMPQEIPCQHPIIGAKEFTKYQDAFTKFKNIRHKIAHRNPRLEIDEYSFEELEKDLDSTELDFEELTQSWEKIEFLRETIFELQESMNEMSHILKKLTLVIGMATIYPSLLDAVLFVMLSES